MGLDYNSGEMSVITEKEQIHIYTSGKNIAETFKSSVKKYHIDRIIVFNEILDNEEDHPEIENAVESLGKKAKDNGIDFKTVKVHGNNMEEVIETMVKLKDQFPEDCFYFNLTGGRKVLALYLYTMAIWLDGFPYYVDLSGDIIEFNIPRIKRETLRGNPNLVKILQIVSEKQEGSKADVRNSDVYEELSESYQPSERTARKGNYKLSRGTFSKWIRILIENQLLSENFSDDNHKSKYLSVTRDGIFALRFFRE